VTTSQGPETGQRGATGKEPNVPGTLKDASQRGGVAEQLRRTSSILLLETDVNYRLRERRERSKRDQPWGRE